MISYRFLRPLISRRVFFRVRSDGNSFNQLLYKLGIKERPLCSRVIQREKLSKPSGYNYFALL